MPCFTIKGKSNPTDMNTIEHELCGYLYGHLKIVCSCNGYRCKTMVQNNVVK